MNFITFNIVMLMIKITLEQLNIINIEISILLLSLLNNILLLDDYINFKSIIEITILIVLSLFHIFKNSEQKTPNINFNITL